MFRHCLKQRSFVAKTDRMCCLFVVIAMIQEISKIWNWLLKFASYGVHGEQIHKNHSMDIVKSKLFSFSQNPLIISLLCGHWHDLRSNFFTTMRHPTSFVCCYCYDTRSKQNIKLAIEIGKFWYPWGTTTHKLSIGKSTKINCSRF